MTSRKLMRLPCAPLAFLAFFSTALTVQLFSLLLALWQRDWTALAGGAFLGLLAGAGAAALAFVFVCAFNLLAPQFGGLRVGWSEEEAQEPAQPQT